MKQFLWRFYHSLPPLLQKKAYNLYMPKKNLPKPAIIKTKSEPVFCFSLDMDLAIGLVHSRHPWKVKGFLNWDREAFFPLLDCLKKHKIKATWGICGHAFLEKCEKVKGVAHPNLKRIKAEWYKGDWYREDPCTDFNADKNWYAPDLIKILQKEKHEIACHSFSHILFSHKTCTREVAEQELSECIKVASRYNIKLNSFIYPYNEVGYVDLLRKFGFKAFRSEKCFIGDPISAKGVYEIPSVAPIINHPQTENYVFETLEKGIKNGGIIHFWSHPWNFKDKKLLLLLGDFLDEVKSREDEGKIRVETMGNLV